MTKEENLKESARIRYLRVVEGPKKLPDGRRLITSSREVMRFT